MPALYEVVSGTRAKKQYQPADNSGKKELPTFSHLKMYAAICKKNVIETSNLQKLGNCFFVL